MRPHWDNCIAHFDDDVGTFIDDYFGEDNRRCLLVAAAGFDPRSMRIANLLSATLGDRLSALFIREERGEINHDLATAADGNEDALRMIVPECEIEQISIFDLDDGAAVGGQRIASILAAIDFPSEPTDIVLDMSALSTGIGFPAARVLLEKCENSDDLSFHVMISSNPDLDDEISSEPSDRAAFVRGFSANEDGGLPPVRIWLPQLSKGRALALEKIKSSVGECYKVCPILPFPSRNPRRSDALIAEFEVQIADEWQVDSRDLIYISEHNPIDCFRTLSTLKDRFERTMSGIYEPQIILSPIGSKVLAAGAMMAAIEHNLAVSHVEALRYDFDTGTAVENLPPDNLVHILLSGPCYGDYNSTTAG